MKRLLVCLLIGILQVAPLAAQDFPNRPIRIIAPFGPGTATDTVARVIAAELTRLTGQPAVVDNKPGAEGQIGAQAAATAAPDGYTIFVTTQTTQSINQHVYKSLQYDPIKSFAPISALSGGAQIVMVRNDLPVKTIPELIALAKAQPGKLTFGSGGLGSYNHLGGELLKSMAHIELLHVPYKGIGDAVAAMLGGQISMAFVQVSSAKPHIDSGKLRAIALASPQRNPVIPNVPTVNEAGNFKGFEAVSWYALVGPAGMPRRMVTRIQSDVAQAVQAPDVREKLTGAGADPVGGTPEQLRAHMRAESDRYGPLIRKLGLKAE